MQNHHFLRELDHLQNPQWAWTCQTDFGPKIFWGRLVYLVSGQGYGRAKRSWGLAKISYLLYKHIDIYSIISYLLYNHIALFPPIVFGDCFCASGTSPCLADQHIGWSGQEGDTGGQMEPLEEPFLAQFHLSKGVQRLPLPWASTVLQGLLRAAQLQLHPCICGFVILFLLHWVWLLGIWDCCRR